MNQTLLQKFGNSSERMEKALNALTRGRESWLRTMNNGKMKEILFFPLKP